MMTHEQAVKFVNEKFAGNTKKLIYVVLNHIDNDDWSELIEYAGDYTDWNNGIPEFTYHDGLVRFWRQNNELIMDVYQEYCEGMVLTGDKIIERYSAWAAEEAFKLLYDYR